MQASIDGIPTNPLLDNDPVLSNLDAAITSRAAVTDINDMKGTGFTPATDSLEAIRAAVDSSIDLSPVLSELDNMKGTGFTSGDDDMTSSNSTGKNERSSIKADTLALLAEGEGF